MMLWQERRENDKKQKRDGKEEPKNNKGMSLVNISSRKASSMSQMKKSTIRN
jgi:hypothetical protein